MKKETLPTPAQTGAASAEGTDAATAAPPANISMDYSGEFNVGNLHLRSTATGVNLRHDNVGSHGIAKAKPAAGLPTASSGFGAAGELRIGKITLAVSDDATTLRLRRENVGHQTETDATTFVELLTDVFFGDETYHKPAELEAAEPSIEGVLDAAFFTRFVAKDGTVTTRLPQVREQKNT